MKHMEMIDGKIHNYFYVLCGCGERGRCNSPEDAVRLEQGQFAGEDLIRATLNSERIGQFTES
jgi:hypothetical protein